jgi:hypothetical protein
LGFEGGFFEQGKQWVVRAGSDKPVDEPANCGEAPFV